VDRRNGQLSIRARSLVFLDADAAPGRYPDRARASRRRSSDAPAPCASSGRTTCSWDSPRPSCRKPISNS
jgi:hypothetical protein